MVKKLGETLENSLGSILAESLSSNSRKMEDFSRLMQEVTDAPTARGIFKKIAARIKEFEANLSHEEEVGLKLASFGQSITIHVNEVNYIQPSIIIFRGQLDNNQTVELLQHINQLNFLLLIVPRITPDEPRRPIGFAPWSDK